MQEQYMQQLIDSNKALMEKFDSFGNRLTKIETMFEMFERSQNNLSEKVDGVDQVAREAMASTKAAHKRLDTIENDISDNANAIHKLTQTIQTQSDNLTQALQQQNKDFYDAMQQQNEKLTKADSDQDKQLSTLEENKSSDNNRLIKLEKTVFWAGTTLIISEFGIIGWLVKISMGGQ